MFFQNAATIDDVLLQRTERAFVCGKTGSGKTALVERLAKVFRHVIALDPKRTLGMFTKGPQSGKRDPSKWIGFKRVVTLEAVTRAYREGNTRIIYAPIAAEQSPEFFNAFFEWVFRSRNWLLYVDEFTLVGRGENVPFYYRACYMQGRELGITTITATQRPIGVAGFIKSESERAYVFNLHLPQDKENVRLTFGLAENDLNSLRKHQFFYLTQEGTGYFGPLILDPKLF